MFFIYLLSCGTPGVVPSETIESSDLQFYREENKILYQEKYDMKKKIDNCTNHLQYCREKKNDAEFVEQALLGYYEDQIKNKHIQCNIEAQNCRNMLDDCRGKMKHEIQSLKQIAVRRREQNNNPELEKCKGDVNYLQNKLQMYNTNFSESISMCRMINSKLKDYLKDITEKNYEIIDMWFKVTKLVDEDYPF